MRALLRCGSASQPRVIDYQKLYLCPNTALPHSSVSLKVRRDTAADDAD